MRSILFLSTVLLCTSLNAQSVYDLFAGDPFSEFNREQKHCSMRDLKECDVSVEAHRVQLTKCQDGIMLSGGYLDLNASPSFSNRKFFWFSEAEISCDTGKYIVNVVNNNPGTVWSKLRLVMQPHDCGFALKQVQILVGRGGALRFIQWTS
jgi:hypothetical protein